MSIAMWKQALVAMPRLDKAAWDHLDLLSRWLIATRFAVVVMTATAAAFGGLLAYRAGFFEWKTWLLVTLGLALAHATNNLLNDLTDYWKGVDQNNYFRARYGPQPIEAGMLTVRQSLIYTVVTGGLAMAIGVYLVSKGGSGVLWLLLAGAFFVLFYTWPLKYIGLGEPAVLLVWGPLMVGGTYYVITGQWSNQVALASLVYALGPTAVLFGKHIDKITDDTTKQIRTLPVLLGERAARVVAFSLFIAQYALLVYLVVVGYWGWPMLLTLAALPSLIRVYRVFTAPRPAEPPPELPKNVWPLWYVAAAFWFTRRFGLMFVVALLIDTLLR